MTDSEISLHRLLHDLVRRAHETSSMDKPVFDINVNGERKGVVGGDAAKIFAGGVAYACGQVFEHWEYPGNTPPETLTDVIDLAGERKKRGMD